MAAMLPCRCCLDYELISSGYHTRMLPSGRGSFSLTNRHSHSSIFFSCPRNQFPSGTFTDGPPTFCGDPFLFYIQRPQDHKGGVVKNGVPYMFSFWFPFGEFGLVPARGKEQVLEGEVMPQGPQLPGRT